MSEKTEGIYEMFWDCAFCDTRALLGVTNRFCPSCGAPQDETRRYFPPEGKEVVANTAFDGVDVKCSACGTPNGLLANNCKNCGSPLSEGAAVKKLADRDNRPAALVAPPPVVKRGMGVVAKTLLAGGLLLAVLIIAALTWKKQVTATVESHSWKREIAIEAMTQVNDSAWKDSLPSDAYSVSCSKEQRSTKKVADGETCHTRDVDRGNGTFERKNVCETKYRDEPVYDEKCRYSVDRWKRARGVTATGGLADAPSWPAVNLHQTGSCRGCEREGAHSEEFLVGLSGPKNERYSCDKPQAEWRSFEQGRSYPLKVRMMTGGADCDSLKP